MKNLIAWNKIFLQRTICEVLTSAKQCDASGNNLIDKLAGQLLGRYE